MMIEKTYLSVFAYFWPVAIFIGVAHYVLGLWVLDADPLALALSYLLGATVSMMLMSHNYKSLLKTTEQMPQKLSKVTTRNYLFRYFFYAFIITLAFLHPFLVVWPVFLGLLTFKFVMMVTFIVASRRDDYG